MDNFRDIIILICTLVVAYGVLVIATAYVKWTITRMKKLKLERQSEKTDRYGKRVEATKETLVLIDSLIKQLVVVEFHELDDKKGIGRTNVSHYKKLLERISNEIHECLEFEFNTILRNTLLDRKFIDYYIIRHTELYLKQVLKVAIDEEDEGPVIDLGGNNG